MKHLIATLIILLICAVAFIFATQAGAAYEWVRTADKDAAKCHYKGDEPGNMLDKNKRYYRSKTECDKTLGKEIP